MESTVASKLEALLKLQNIDSQLDEIRRVRGDLPEEVQDLEDEIEGYEVRVRKFDDEIAGLNDSIAQRKQAIKDAESLIRKYEDQQSNVRNNREYESLSKEIEFQELEIKLHEKKSKEAKIRITQKKELLDEAKERLNFRKEDLKTKKAELDEIIAETQKDEDGLVKSSEKAKAQIEDRLLVAYTRLRQNAKNGLAVVPVERDSCGGCFNQIPPQRQLDIEMKKKVIVCEHCGRILVPSIKED